MLTHSDLLNRTAFSLHVGMNAPESDIAPSCKGKYIVHSTFLILAHMLPFSLIKPYMILKIG